MPTDLEDFWAWRDDLARRFVALRIAETPACAGAVSNPTRPDERLAQCIWFDSLFVHDTLRTDSGKTLEIVQPGRWNLEEGPDFRDAKIRVGGELLQGDIEVHLAADGWRQHRHHLNAQYNGVVLHVYLWRAPDPARAETAQGKAIEGFCMEPILFPDLEAIRQTVRVEDYPYQTPSAQGRCQPILCSLDTGYVGGLLDAAGRERMETKVRRFNDQAQGASLDQVFYQALMTAMGHKSSKSLFFLLSKRAPLDEMTDYLNDVLPPGGTGDDPDRQARARRFFQSVLFHVAQLIPAEPAAFDDETRAYVEGLRGVWGGFSRYFSDRLIPPTHRWTLGARPVNFAHRRLGGVAHLLARWFLGPGATECFAEKVRRYDPDASRREKLRWIREELIGAFVVEDESDFWTWRFNFVARRSPRPLKLIGEDRAASIVFNALLPLLVVLARRRGDAELERRAWDLFLHFPALESNAIVRHMQARLFGPSERGKDLLNSEARQQGLFQIFAACCNHNETGCEDCYYQQASA